MCPAVRRLSSPKVAAAAAAAAILAQRSVSGSASAVHRRCTSRIVRVLRRVISLRRFRGSSSVRCLPRIIGMPAAAAASSPGSRPIPPASSDLRGSRGGRHPRCHRSGRPPVAARCLARQRCRAPGGQVPAGRLASDLRCQGGRPAGGRGRRRCRVGAQACAPAVPGARVQARRRSAASPSGDGLPAPSPEPDAGARKRRRAERQPSGMTTSVRKVATSDPNSSDTAMPRKIGSVSSTIEPMTSASAVIRIGRRRTCAASDDGIPHASCPCRPRRGRIPPAGSSCAR